MGFHFLLSIGLNSLQSKRRGGRANRGRWGCGGEGRGADGFGEERLKVQERSEIRFRESPGG